MKVTLNLTRLKGNNLTPNEYIYLLLKDSGDKQALKYREILTPLDLEKLQSKGMIKILPNNTVTLRQKAIDLFRVRGCEKCWDEFNVAYPIREGDRPLHNDKKKCKIKYMSLVEKKEFRPQWKLMSTYINQESWTMYEDYEATHDTPGELGFGEELL